jgi:peroxiredoxin
MFRTCSTLTNVRSILTRLFAPFALLALLPLQSAGAQSLQLLVPAYFYPGGPGLNYWNELDATASQAPLNVIFNPDSGPGPTVNSDYTQAVTNVRAAGAQTFAYLYTDYGNRPLADVEQDVATYLALYPHLESGFFLDQVSNDPTTLPYYDALYAYIKGLNSSLRIIGNPGVNAPQSFFTGPAFDTLVTFENYASAYPSYQPDPYMLTIGSDHFANIIHDEPTVAGMESDLAEAVSNNDGYIYVTDDTQSGMHPNPYDALPSYWDQEVAAVHALASVPEPSATGMAAVLLGLGLIAMSQRAIRRRQKRGVPATAGALGVCLLLASAPRLLLAAQTQTTPTARSTEQQSIDQRLGSLRQLPDDKRASVTKQLALDIRQLPDPTTRVNLASALANLATEGDFGHDTLQEVATTLAEALRAHPITSKNEPVAGPYVTLAQLVRYENVRASLDDPQFTAAMYKLETDDRQRQQADFTLTDLDGKPWTLKSLHGKVVLVNFWATWCPPCRKELPDLETLYNRFKDRGFVILGISDEEAGKVQPFVAKQKLTYPILLDPGRKVNEQFQVMGIPRTFIYDRNGKLAAQAIDMRTQRQLLALLARAGLH